MTIEKLKQRKLGNSGFSLVELIIVIAIMAILIAVLAPMFIRYVERSRMSRDIQAAGQIANAMKTASSDPAFTLGNPFTVTWTPGTNTVAVTAGDTATNQGAASLEATLGALNAITSVSTTFNDPLTFTLNPATGALTVAGGTTIAAGDTNADYWIAAIAGIK